MKVTDNCAVAGIITSNTEPWIIFILKQFLELSIIINLFPNLKAVKTVLQFQWSKAPHPAQSQSSRLETGRNSRAWIHCSWELESSKWRLYSAYKWKCAARKSSKFSASCGQAYLNVGVEMKRSVPFSRGGNRFPHLYRNLKWKIIS